MFSENLLQSNGLMCFRLLRNMSMYALYCHTNAYLKLNLFFKYIHFYVFRNCPFCTHCLQMVSIYGYIYVLKNHRPKEKADDTPLVNGSQSFVAKR